MRPVTDFAECAERHRGELRVHCYRMLGSFDEAEDLVQEVFLRGVARPGRLRGPFLTARLVVPDRHQRLPGLPRRPPPDAPDQADSPAGPWLQPLPCHLWEPMAPSADDPEAAVVAKEILELAFQAAIQHLPPRQRAATILCDVLGWPVRQTAEASTAVSPRSTAHCSGPEPPCAPACRAAGRTGPRQPRPQTRTAGSCAATCPRWSAAT
ncbi:hypothetical protein Acor_81490 [Acrocarpospora corrugata]|uniref:RNA polymerase sigma-70 region 2 domain-containing protein n=1 Tax=Acrocarpospora corrugata TaxID=35763 RepID=A0A5M3WCT9_9ACTN|nr:hypothetical protein Acor_81490 [Acrocarpospora corrugata]